jgi:hypothetical protein
MKCLRAYMENLFLVSRQQKMVRFGSVVKIQVVISFARKTLVTCLKKP